MSEIGVLSESSVVNHEFIAPKKAPEFDFEDLVFIEKTGIGLRHVSTRSMAEENVSNGFYGDALALSSIGKTFFSRSENVFSGNEKGEKILGMFRSIGLIPKLDSTKEFFNDDEKNKIVNLMHKNVIGFVHSALDIGLSGTAVRGVTTVSEELDKINSRSSFLLVKTDVNVGSYDNDRYHELGKVGKRSFKPNDVVGLIKGDEVVGDLRARGVDSQSKLVDEEFFSKVDESYYGLIVNSVKKLRSVS